MGVYIKGMEMPTRCYTCPCADLEFHDCNLIPGTRIEQHKRLDDCPLVPVPPHGRLSDADALADVFRGFIAMYDSCPFGRLSLPDKARRDELQSALAEVINAPTIIEAEEGET